MLAAITTAIATAVLAYIGVAVFRRWSHSRELFDIPNDRSSHTEPTPRGGGLVIVVLSLLAYLLGSAFAGSEVSVGFIAASISVAAISWLDDIRSISFVIRFLVHAAAAAIVIFDIGSWNTVSIPGIATNIGLGIFGPVITGLWIVWLINAYNFMDGIDGIAGTQAAVAGIAWSMIALFFGAVNAGVLTAAIAGAAIGFLFHNWQPAKVFMGDVGSAYLGFVFAVIPLMFSTEPAVSGYMPLLAVALLWMFVFDTVWTFFRRLLRGERVWNAHREHLYQRLVRSGYQHRTVTLLYTLGACIIAFLWVWGVYDPAGRIWIALVMLVPISTALLIFVEVKKKFDLSAQKC